jgi:hypothetical protein
VVTTTTDAADANLADGVCASTLPGAPCTLRAAVQTANARPGFDAITISPTIARPTSDPDCTTNWLGQPDRQPAFHLTVLGQGEDAAATGDLDVTGPTSIADACNITVDGDRNDRIWDVRSTLELTNVQTTNGAAPSGEGAGSGIAVRSGASLTIHRGNVNSGSAEFGGGIGGDLYAGPDTNVLLDNTNINTGSAEFGGGIYTEGHLEINGSVFDDHDAKQGGGLFLAGGSTAVVRDAVMVDSQTAGFGGGGAHVFAAPGSHATFIHTVFGAAGRGDLQRRRSVHRRQRHHRLVRRNRQRRGHLERRHGALERPALDGLRQQCELLLGQRRVPVQRRQRNGHQQLDRR